MKPQYHLPQSSIPLLQDRCAERNNAYHVRTTAEHFGIFSPRFPYKLICGRRDRRRQWCTSRWFVPPSSLWRDPMIKILNGACFSPAASSGHVNLDLISHNLVPRARLEKPLPAWQLHRNAPSKTFLSCAWPRDERSKIFYLMDGALAVFLFEWGGKETLSPRAELQITDTATSENLNVWIHSCAVEWLKAKHQK